ncbi:MAG: sulfur carrier protein ThiS [Bermanella sp.]|tara:strand:+ start:269 stop:481 length:213 start_codon:yes stop_codon:yes gene_type:complete
MNIRYNGEVVELNETMSLLAFLQNRFDDWEVVIARSVVAVNQQLVPRQEYDGYILQKEDDIELLTAVVGG